MICWILALSAGLYLYRAKHEVELMDKHIDQIAKDTNNLRVESRRLMDDWIRLGEPEQLRKYSDEYLGLKAVAPTQFVRLADLPNRLPTPRADPIDTPGEPEDQTPVAQSDPQAGEANSVNEAAADDLPVPPIPPTAQLQTPTAQSSTAQSSTVQSSTTQPPALQPVAVSIPLQARPVTPRPPAEQQEQEAIRPRPTAEPRLAEEPHAPPAKPIEPKPVPMRLAEPRQAAPTQGSSVQAAAQVAPSPLGGCRPRNCRRSRLKVGVSGEIRRPGRLSPTSPTPARTTVNKLPGRRRFGPSARRRGRDRCSGCNAAECRRRCRLPLRLTRPGRTPLVTEVIR